MGGSRQSRMIDGLKAAGVVSVTVAACMFGALVGTTGVIAWAAYDVWRRHG